MRSARGQDDHLRRLGIALSNDDAARLVGPERLAGVDVRAHPLGGIDHLGELLAIDVREREEARVARQAALARECEATVALRQADAATSAVTSRLSPREIPE